MSSFYWTWSWGLWHARICELSWRPRCTDTADIVCCNVRCKKWIGTFWYQTDIFLFES